MRSLPATWFAHAHFQPEHDRFFDTRLNEQTGRVAFRPEHVQEMTWFSVIVQAGYGIPYGGEPMSLETQGYRARHIVQEFQAKGK